MTISRMRRRHRPGLQQVLERPDVAHTPDAMPSTWSPQGSPTCSPRNPQTNHRLLHVDQVRDQLGRRPARWQPLSCRSRARRDRRPCGGPRRGSSRGSPGTCAGSTTPLSATGSDGLHRSAASRADLRSGSDEREARIDQRGGGDPHRPEQVVRHAAQRGLDRESRRDQEGRRWTTSPRVSVNSALVTGTGAEKLNGPLRSGDSISSVAARTQSLSEMNDMY